MPSGSGAVFHCCHSSCGICKSRCSQLNSNLHPETFYDPLLMNAGEQNISLAACVGLISLLLGATVLLVCTWKVFQKHIIPFPTWTTPKFFTDPSIFKFMSDGHNGQSGFKMWCTYSSSKILLCLPSFFTF